MQNKNAKFGMGLKTAKTAPFFAGKGRLFCEYILILYRQSNYVH